MAGLSQRFRNAGYATPKAMLELHGRTVFARAVLSFEHDFRRERFLFVVRDEADAPAFVEAEARTLGVADFSIAVLREPTRGQAETVRLGLQQSDAPDDEPLVIFNIDTFRPGFRQPDAPWSGTAAGWLEVMPSDDPGFSYARPVEGSPDNRVAETAEKRVISSWASTGMYGFASRRLFDEAYELQAGTLSAGELYVAPLYNALIAQGRPVHYQPVPPELVIFCGTPAQYEALQAHPDRLQDP